MAKVTKKISIKETPTKKPFYKNLTCFKCNKKGHISKFCRLNRKIQEFDLGEELSSKISNLLLHYSSSSYDYDSPLSSEKALQVDELKSDSSTSSESEETKFIPTRNSEFHFKSPNKTKILRNNHFVPK